MPNQDVINRSSPHTGTTARMSSEDLRAEAAGDDSYLDIPAFLRRQAD